MSGTPENQKSGSAQNVNRPTSTVPKKKKLTQKRLKELMEYNPETGEFTRKTAPCNGTKVGDIAGGCDSEGYIRIRVGRKRHFAHRLAWLYVRGFWPKNEIDHINRDPSDNRLCNLREVSHQCNMRNCGNPKTNTSGVKGVRRHKRRKKWEARICVDNEYKFLGTYNSFDNAVCARLAAEQCLNWSGCDSSSPAYQYVQKMLKEPR